VDKVALEKNRINDRVGLEAKMQRENAPMTSAELTSCSTGPGHIADYDRFHSDTAGEEYQARQVSIAKKQQSIAFRRNQRDAREEERWKQVDRAIYST
jgi:hypothetical protein